ncbi:Alcohol dehydrogenase superfamily zinc-containing [Macrophomina phaseolina MS6]|uniref:Alcohol dehydrogenase superfamily zinc-containing n=1 Tax=Macrophomina phaseolina (strain MS6) TaxID=1126212 RepID=K2RZS3_MACPH|nr:Alcohol dehydrogenase superfamily zinc-containing [Macrophomina phaseolina MS6]
MKALVYNGADKGYAVEDRPVPTVQAPTDAVIQLKYTTICGSDLHILKGDVPTVTPGRVLGHEGVGVVHSVGSSVTKFKEGDLVLITAITGCGSCHFCRKGMHSQCEDGGWVLGHTVDGTQAEYVRIPHAETSMYKAPANVDPKTLVMLSDILPTGFECGVLNAKVEPGCSVLIIGAGPVGLAALLTAQLYAPGLIIVVDFDENRLRVARELGAHATATPPEAEKVVMGLTGGRGCDAVLEVVGIPQTFHQCQELVGAGGVIANVGVHGTKVDLHLEKLWSKNIAITTRLVDTATVPMLLKLVAAKKLPAEKLITHNFAFTDMMNAYGTFSAASANKALKVIIEF